MDTLPEYLLIVIKVQDGVRVEQQRLVNFRSIDLSPVLLPGRGEG